MISRCLALAYSRNSDMKLFIKNMVCRRCKMAVSAIFENLGIVPESISLGQIDLAADLSKDQLALLQQQLQKIGFELIDDRKSRTVEKIKNLIIDLVHNRDNELNMNLSNYLADEIKQDYSSLSSLFSQQESTTIEQFYILQKIERVKELLAYDELNLNEIADRLHYSSASHLTRQFKKVTGLTPTYFKNIGHERRNQIENI